jgi:ribose transport system substrate-binding protein
VNRKPQSVKIAVVVFAITLSLSGCHPIRNTTIAFMPGIADPFYFTMERGIRAKAQELGVTLLIGDYPTTWGPEAQVPILQAMMANGGIGMLLIAPTSVDALVAPLKKIYDSGVQIITVDTYIGDGDYSKSSNYSFPLTYIGSDNELGGKQIAEQLAKLLGEKGKVFCESTSPNTSYVASRVTGFKEGISEFPNMTLIGVDYCMDVQQIAMQQVSAALQKDPDIVGIFGVNVFSAQGAYQAAVNAGLTGVVKIATWDATETLIQALKAGQVDLVLAQKPAEIGSLAVDYGYKFLTAGTAIPKKVIPGFEFFTKANVDNLDMQQWIYKN